MDVTGSVHHVEYMHWSIIKNQDLAPLEMPDPIPARILECRWKALVDYRWINLFS